MVIFLFGSEKFDAKARLDCIVYTFDFKHNATLVGEGVGGLITPPPSNFFLFSLTNTISSFRKD